MEKSIKQSELLQIIGEDVYDILGSGLEIF